MECRVVAIEGSVDAACADERLAGVDLSAATMLHAPEVSSTNDIAKAAARMGAAEGWSVRADSQDAGRGRRGHAWASPSGGLYLTVVVRPHVPMHQLMGLTPVAGLAVLDALRSVLPDAPLGLKWPNDIVAARVEAKADGTEQLKFDRKLGGILVEGGTGADGVFAVIGVGVNLQRLAPGAADELNDPAVLKPISIRELIGADDKVPSVDDLALAIRFALLKRVSAWAATLSSGMPVAGPVAPVLAEYVDNVPMLGHGVQVLTPEGAKMDVGTLAGFDAWGHAIVVLPDGQERTFSAEEASLREY